MPTTDPRLKRIEDANKRLTVSNEGLNTQNRKLITTNQKLNGQIADLRAQNKEVAERLRTKEKELTTKTLLRQNPFVNELIASEKAKFSSDIGKKNIEIKRLQDDLLKLKADYAHLDKIEPVQKDEFNRFLSSSIMDLQSELSSTDSDYEFIVRDLEVETNLLVESREVMVGRRKERKLVYILPTTKQLNDIDPGMMNRLKFSLSVVPKE